MTYLLRFAALALITALATPAVAGVDDFNQRLHLNVAAGWKYFDDKRQFSENSEFHYGAEWRILPNWAVEATLVRGETKAKSGQSARDGYYDIRLDGLYYFNMDFGWQPFVVAGIGETQFEDVGDTRFGERNEVRMNAGGGYRYIVSDRVSLRGALRGFYGPRDDTFDAVVTLGISLDFQLAD